MKMGHAQIASHILGPSGLTTKHVNPKNASLMKEFLKMVNAGSVRITPLVIGISQIKRPEVMIAYLKIVSLLNSLR
jgi:hypothetical protein